MTASPRQGGDRLDNPSLLNQYDRPEVVVRKAAGQPAHTNALPIRFDVHFDEPVVDFPTGYNVDGIVFSGTASGLHYEVTGEKAHYQVTVRAVAQDGTLTVAVPPRRTADLFGNVNYASTDEGATVHYDVSRPRCVIQSDQEGVMNDAHMAITLIFSEPVFGLQDSALAVENATLVRRSGGDGDTRYQFTVSPHADGTTALRVPEDAVRDAVGNGNEASPEFSLVVDSTGPTVTLTSFETARETNSRTIRVHAVFDEPVRDFVQGDIAVEGAAVLNFTAREDGVTFVFDVRPTAEWVRVHLPAGAARDVIGNPSAASDVFTRRIDTTRPQTTVELDEAGIRAGQPVPLTITFSEPVYGLVASGIEVSRGAIHRIQGEDGDRQYRYLVAPRGSQRVEVRVPNGAATDLAGNPCRSARIRFTPPSPADARQEESGLAAPPLGD